LLLMPGNLGAAWLFHAARKHFGYTGDDGIVSSYCCTQERSAIRVHGRRGRGRGQQRRFTSIPS
jgi:hypothetical protein